MPAQQRNLTLASHFLVMERPERARDYLQQATLEERETSRYFYLLADSYYQEANYTDAIATTKDGLAIYPEDYQLLQVLTNCYVNTDAYESAETNVINALKIHPESATLHFQYAHLEWKLKRYDSAETILEQGRQLNPQAAYVHHLSALIAKSRKKWDSAETHAKAFIKDNPQNSQAYSVLADIYSLQGRRLEADEYLKRAAQLNPAGPAGGNLNRRQTSRANFMLGLMVFSAIGYLGLAFVGWMAYSQEGSRLGLAMVACTIPISFLMAYYLKLSRTPVDIQKRQLSIGHNDRTVTIPFEEITKLTNSQFGIKVTTHDKTYRIYRLNQQQQVAMFLKLRNLTPDAHDAMVNRIEEPLPFRVTGFYGSILGSLFLIGCSAILLYAAFYSIVISTSDDIDMSGIVVISICAVFTSIIGVFWFGSLPWWWAFSAETIATRYPFKTKTYDATQIEHVGLKRGYRMYKGNQMVNMSIEIHLKDGEIITIDQDHVRRPVSDWSPLYELTARLQTQYNATAPHHSAETISPYIL